MTGHLNPRFEDRRKNITNSDNSPPSERAVAELHNAVLDAAKKFTDSCVDLKPSKRTTAAGLIIEHALKNLRRYC